MKTTISKQKLSNTGMRPKKTVMKKQEKCQIFLVIVKPCNKFTVVILTVRFWNLPFLKRKINLARKNTQGSKLQTLSLILSCSWLNPQHATKCHIRASVLSIMQVLIHFTWAAFYLLYNLLNIIVHSRQLAAKVYESKLGEIYNTLRLGLGLSMLKVGWSSYNNNRIWVESSSLYTGCLKFTLKLDIDGKLRYNKKFMYTVIRKQHL